MVEEAKRYAVVTGANKGLGFGTCQKLASRGIKVVLTARNGERGLEAVERMKEFGLSDFVVFHQLDVTDPASIASLADFIKTQFGKLDILVNNAGVAGGIVNGNALFRKNSGEQVDWSEIVEQSYELAEECVETNYNGTVRVTEALLPLLHLSSSARIVNVTSIVGMIKLIPNEWAKAVLSEIESLTRETLDKVVREYLKDYKEGSLKAKGWPAIMSANIVSKTALNAYTRMLARKCPSFLINSVTPGFVKTDMTQNYGFSSVEEGAEHIVRLALLPDNGPSGLFFDKDVETAIE